MYEDTIYIYICMLFYIYVYIYIYTHIYLYSALSFAPHGLSVAATLRALGQDRLQAMYTLKQLSREWSRGLSAFEWLTEDGMRAINWSENLASIKNV